MRRVLSSLILFGIAFGFVEASVVVYLRMLSEPVRAAVGLPPTDLFPLVKPDQLGPRLFLAKIEIAREAATLLMLTAIAAAAAKNRRTWLAAFAIAFGVWDLAFYGSLKVLIGWPPSWMTWDILFLLPVPWTGPVLAPVIVAASLTAGGIIGLMRESSRGSTTPNDCDALISPESGQRNRSASNGPAESLDIPPKMDRWATTLVALGGVIVFVSFIWDWRHIASGATPHNFPWWIFSAGEIAGVTGLLRAIGRGPRSSKRVL